MGLGSSTVDVGKEIDAAPELARGVYRQIQDLSGGRGRVGLTCIRPDSGPNTPESLLVPTVHVLSSIHPLTDYFLFRDWKSHLRASSSNTAVVVAYARLLESMWLGAESVVGTGALYEALMTAGSDVHEGWCGSVHRTTMDLLRRLHDGLNCADFGEEVGDLEASVRFLTGDEMETAAFEAELADWTWERHCESHLSAIVELLHGLVRVEQVCCGCGQRRVWFEVVQSICGSTWEGAGLGGVLERWSNEFELGKSADHIVCVGGHQNWVCEDCSFEEEVDFEGEEEPKKRDGFVGEELLKKRDGFEVEYPPKKRDGFEGEHPPKKRDGFEESPKKVGQSRKVAHESSKRVNHVGKQVGMRRRVRLWRLPHVLLVQVSGSALTRVPSALMDVARAATPGSPAATAGLHEERVLDVVGVVGRSEERVGVRVKNAVLGRWYSFGGMGGVRRWKEVCGELVEMVCLVRSGSGDVRAHHNVFLELQEATLAVEAATKAARRRAVAARERELRSITLDHHNNNNINPNNNPPQNTLRSGATSRVAATAAAKSPRRRARSVGARMGRRPGPSTPVEHAPDLRQRRKRGDSTSQKSTLRPAATTVVVSMDGKDDETSTHQILRPTFPHEKPHFPWEIEDGDQYFVGGANVDTETESLKKQGRYFVGGANMETETEPLKKQGRYFVGGANTETETESLKKENEEEEKERDDERKRTDSDSNNFPPHHEKPVYFSLALHLSDAESIAATETTPSSTSLDRKPPPISRSPSDSTTAPVDPHSQITHPHPSSSLDPKLRRTRSARIFPLRRDKAKDPTPKLRQRQAPVSVSTDRATLPPRTSEQSPAYIRRDEELPPKKYYEGEEPLELPSKKYLEGEEPLELPPKKYFESEEPLELPTKKYSSFQQHGPERRHSVSEISHPKQHQHHYRRHPTNVGIVFTTVSPLVMPP